MTDFYYREIDESEVDHQKMKEAKRVLRHCKETLSNLPGIKIVWCKETDKNTYGLHNGLARLQENLNKFIGDGSKVDQKYHKEDGSFMGQVCGLTGSKERARMIWLRADIPLDQIGLTIAHECFHLHEFGPYGKYRPPLTETEGKTSDERAETFARKVMKEIKERLA